MVLKKYFLRFSRNSEVFVSYILKNIAAKGQQVLNDLNLVKKCIGSQLITYFTE